VSVSQWRERGAAGVALAAIAKDLKMMTHRMEAHRATGVFLKLLEFLGHELDDFVAL